MLAVRSYAPGEPLRIEEVPIPKPKGTEILVRVGGCGVCHTDLHIARTDRMRVNRPLTLGHEVGGWIDGAGPRAAAELKRARLGDGDAVVVFGGWGCGVCTQCVEGEEQRCDSSTSPGFQVDGGYAEYMLVPHARHLVPLRHLHPDHAAPLADAGVTPWRAVQRAAAWLQPGARVLLIGFGGLGQFALQYLRRLPDLTIAVRELNPDKLALAGDMGADLGLLMGDEALVELGLGGPADVVFDFVGNDPSLEYAVRNVAPGGLVSLVGEAGGRYEFSFRHMPSEASLTTTGWGSLNDLREVVRLAKRGSLKWHVERMPLAQAAVAHDRLAEGRVSGRIVLVPGADAGASSGELPPPARNSRPRGIASEKGPPRSSRRG